MSQLRRSGTIQQRGVVVVVMLVLSTFLVMLLAGHEPWSGPVIWGFTRSHGLHITDVPLIVLWAIGMLGAAVLWPPKTPD